MGDEDKVTGKGVETPVLLSELRDLTAKIQSLVSNIGKTAVALRTTANRETKLVELSNLWAKFKAIHDRLKTDLPEDHPFHAEQFDVAAIAQLKAGKEKLETWRSLKSNNEDTNNTSDPPVGGQSTANQQRQNLDSNSVPPNGRQNLPPPPNQDQWSTNGYHQFVAPAAPKLAPITIPTFSGEWKEWTAFSGLFDSLIDANPYLAPVQKLQYLINYLQGEAREAIDHILLCNESYPIAMNILRNRFNNKRKICDEYVANLLNLPKMEVSTAAGILNISNVLTLSLHGLQRYEYDTSSWAPFVVYCVTSTLDEESRQKFEESLENSREVPTIKILTAFLDRRYQVLLSEPRSKSQAPARKNSYTAFTQEEANKRGKDNRSCVLCHAEGHYILLGVSPYN